MTTQLYEIMSIVPNGAWATLHNIEHTSNKHLLLLCMFISQDTHEQESHDGLNTLT